MKGLTTKSYLTKSLLNTICNKELTNEEINTMILSGKLEKRASYYQPTFTFLKELGIIPKKVEIADYPTLAKSANFTLHQIREVFGDCHMDVAKQLARKYFVRKYNYYYKNDILNELLMEGKSELYLE